MSDQEDDSPMRTAVRGRVTIDFDPGAESFEVIRNEPPA